MSFHNKCRLDERGRDGDDRKPAAFVDDRHNRVTPYTNNDSIACIVSEDGANLAMTRLARSTSANLNLMDPEDWLIKHQERIEQTAHRLKPAGMKSGESDDSALKYPTECNETSNNQKNSDDYEKPGTIASGFSKTAQSSETRTSGSESYPTVSRRHYVEHGVQEMLTADVQVIQTFSPTEDNSMPEMQTRNSGISRQSFAGSLVEDILLVQGERTQESKNRRALIHVTCAVFVVMAIVAGIVSLFSRKTQASATARNNWTASSPTGSPILVSSSSVDFPNKTLADGFILAANENPGNSLQIIPIADVFLDILRQTDRNMTVFGLTEGAVSQLVNNYQMLKRAIQPTYSGHMVR